MKFETVLYGAAFLILALISFPKNEGPSKQGAEPATLTLAERSEMASLGRRAAADEDNREPAKRDKSAEEAP